MISSFKNTVRNPSLMQFGRGYAKVVREPLVLKEDKSAVSRITLNRPSAYNSFDNDTVDAFQAAIQDAEEDPNIKAIILRGVGKAFSTGGDVKYILNSLNGDATNMNFRSFINRCYNQVYRNARLQTPLVSVLDGITMGLGAGVAMYGPFRIVTEKTKYTMPETNIGMFCDASCAHYLSKLDINLAKYITMTGHFLKGEDVLLSGIGTHFVPSSRLDDLENHMVKETELDLDKINSIIQKYSVDETHKPENHTLNTENYSIIQRCFKFNTAHEIMDALEKDGTAFALEAREAILKRSPIGTAVTVENINRAQHMSFMEIMEMDLSLWFRVAGLHDFSEGVRSNIILKQKPNWNPPNIRDININSLRQNVYQDGKDVKPSVYFPYDARFTPTKFLKYVLPTQQEILKVQREHGLTNLEETVGWFQAKYNNKFGIRQKVELMQFI